MDDNDRVRDLREIDIPALNDQGRAAVDAAVSLVGVKRVHRVYSWPDWMDGLTGRSSPSATDWVMGINGNRTPDQQCFTIVHELGHLVLKHAPTRPTLTEIPEAYDAQEVQADQFSLACLLFVASHEGWIGDASQLASDALRHAHDKVT
jgi:hypothetical protein